MTENKNKPIIFSVAEEKATRPENINAFKQAIKGKKVLFIELTRENVQQITKKGEFSHMPLVAAYQKLSLIAHEAGLKVVALDEQKKMDKLVRAEISASVLSRNLEKDTKNAERLYFLCYNDREKDWIRKLKASNWKAIAVMAPGHASEIAKKLRIPKENIIGKLDERKRPRELAAREAARRREETAIWKRLQAEEELKKFDSFAKRRQARRRLRK